jgi:hypothetical protein
MNNIDKCVDALTTMAGAVSGVRQQAASSVDIAEILDCSLSLTTFFINCVTDLAIYEILLLYQ